MNKKIVDLGLGQLHPSVTGLHLPGGAYAPAAGLLELRSVLAKRHAVSTDALVLTTGASMALVSTLALLPPLSRVAIPRPYFPAYPRICEGLGLRPAPYSALPTIDVDNALGVGCSDACAALVVNTPGNPLGNAVAADSLAELARRAAGQGAILILDLVYRPFEPVPPELPKGDHVVQVYSLGKELGIPGERLGYVVAAPPLAAAISRMHWALAMGPPATGMVMAHKLLLGGVSHSRSVARCVETALGALAGARGVTVRRPEGGFFLWIRLPGWTRGSDALAGACAELGIRLMPASVFGSDEPAVRACAALGGETRASFVRLARALEAVQGY